jgi:hypothetical protein
MGGKKVDFGNSYQIIDVNVLMVHEIAIKRHTNHTAISQLIKKGNKMDYVKQAFSISDEFKKVAVEMYKDSVREIVNKNYTFTHNDAHVELSTIFGLKWLSANKLDVFFWRNLANYAEANIAFNYANFLFYKKSKFIELSKQLVANDCRVNDIKLKNIAVQMNCVLTATSAEEIMRNFVVA